MVTNPMAVATRRVSAAFDVAARTANPTPNASTTSHGTGTRAMRPQSPMASVSMRLSVAAHTAKAIANTARCAGPSCHHQARSAVSGPSGTAPGRRVRRERPSITAWASASTPSTAAATSRGCHQATLNKTCAMIDQVATLVATTTTNASARSVAATSRTSNTPGKARMATATSAATTGPCQPNPRHAAAAIPTTVTGLGPLPGVTGANTSVCGLPTLAAAVVAGVSSMPSHVSEMSIIRPPRSPACVRRRHLADRASAAPARVHNSPRRTSTLRPAPRLDRPATDAAARSPCRERTPWR